MAQGGTPQTIEYNVNDEVFATFQGLLYKAKVLEKKSTPSGMEYKIHYVGWNKRWDEWQKENEIHPFNEHNEQTAASLLNRAKAAEAQAETQTSRTSRVKSKRPTPQDSSRTSSNPRPSKRRRLAGTQPPLEIMLPPELKKCLISDWEQITKEEQLLDLPKPEGWRVTDILDDFVSNGCKIADEEKDGPILREVARGLKEYFDQALPVLLLYKFERPQQENLARNHPSATMSRIYGAEHLCRLFVKLPQLLTNSNLDDNGRMILGNKIDDLVKFILDNKSKYFDSSSYISATDEYKELVQQFEPPTE